MRRLNAASARTVVPTWSAGDRLSKARKEAGIGVGAMAERLGVDASTISRWERAKRVQRMVVRLYSLETRVPEWWLEGADSITDPSGGVPKLSDQRSRNRNAKGQVNAPVRCIQLPSSLAA